MAHDGGSERVTLLVAEKRQEEKKVNHQREQQSEPRRDDRIEPIGEAARGHAAQEHNANEKNPGIADRLDERLHKPSGFRHRFALPPGSEGFQPACFAFEQWHARMRDLPGVFIIRGVPSHRTDSLPITFALALDQSSTDFQSVSSRHS
jgi:hypothetical protein